MIEFGESYHRRKLFAGGGLRGIRTPISLAVPANPARVTTRPPAPASPTRRSRRPWRRWRRPMREAGLRRRPPHRPAARKPARAFAAQAGDEHDRRLLRAAEPGPPPRRAGLRASTTPKSTWWSCCRAGWRRWCSAALAAATHQPPVVAVELRPAACRAAARPAGRRHARIQRHRPACSTPRAPPAGRRAACCRTATSWPPAMAYATAAAWPRSGEGCERIYNPLPLFHVNASVLSFFCALLTGNCQVQTDRFQPSRWWTEVRESRRHRRALPRRGRPDAAEPAARPARPRPRGALRLRRRRRAAAARAFEQRFGFPLLEIWGMTEMVRALVDCHAPRQVGTRAFGRAVAGSGSARRRRRRSRRAPTARRARW